MILTRYQIRYSSYNWSYYLVELEVVVHQSSGSMARLFTQTELC
jgi:hypothetical protein